MSPQKAPPSSLEVLASLAYVAAISGVVFSWYGLFVGYAFAMACLALEAKLFGINWTRMLLYIAGILPGQVLWLGRIEVLPLNDYFPIFLSLFVVPALIAATIRLTNASEFGSVLWLPFKLSALYFAPLILIMVAI